MFTGIIKEVATVQQLQKAEGIIKLAIKGNKVFDDAMVDDSIAVNGVCLTIVSIENSIAVFDVLPETIKRTNLSLLKKDSLVNIEKSLTLADKLGGHILQGHVDDIVEIQDIDQDGEAKVITLKGNKEYINMIVEKAYIALDGISLTIIEVGADYFKVMIIPHTFSNTIISNWAKGSKVNMEVDITNKSIYRYMKLLKNKEI